MSDTVYRQQLQQACKRGERFAYLCFWGHTPKLAGSVDKSCLSQWYPAPFEVGEHCYATAEHYMMAQKALLFDDEAVFERILQAAHPKEAKALGRQVRHYQADVWEAQRFDTVKTANLAKFSQHADLRAFLLATGEQVLVEASPVDAIWGIGLAADHAHATQPPKWRGLNLLGFALMQVRAQLHNTVP